MAEIRVNATGALKLYDNDDSHFVGLQAGSVSSNVTFTLPTADGSNGQFLKTDGSGALSFGSVSSSGAYDLNGGELVLDADADTSITADTDDQIDIRIAGADDFTFTANSFNVLSGSEIDLADNCELRIGDSDDLKLFHQGSHSVIAHGGTGDLQELREKRNDLLAETDWWGTSDNTMTADQIKYRKDLRDLPSGLDTVEKVANVTWPTKP